MNREQALKHLPLIIALTEGKTIQYKPKGGIDFYDTATPIFTGIGEYRIKPEPVYEYVLTYTIHYKNLDAKQCTYSYVYDDKATAERQYEDAIKSGIRKNVSLVPILVQP